MIHIEVQEQSSRRVVVKVEGRLTEDQVSVLEAEGERLLEESAYLVLEVAGLRFVDDGGIELLRRWSDGRMSLRGASPFIDALLTQRGVIAARKEKGRRSGSPDSTSTTPTHEEGSSS